MFQHKDLPEVVAESYFKNFDSNNDGRLDDAEMDEYLKYIGFDRDSSETIKRVIDRDGDGYYSFEEFYTFLKNGRQLSVHMSNSCIAILELAFSYFKQYCVKGKNLVDRTGFRRMISDNGLSDVHLEPLFIHLDKDKSGFLSFPELMTYLKLEKQN